MRDTESAQKQEDARPLDEAFAVAEGIAAERQALQDSRLEVLEKLVAAEFPGRGPSPAKARRHHYEVLRCLCASGAVDAAVEASPAKISRPIWCCFSDRTVQRVLAYWRQQRVLAMFERLDENGGSLPPLARMVWPTIVSRLARLRTATTPGDENGASTGPGPALVTAAPSPVSFAREGVTHCAPRGDTLDSGPLSVSPRGCHTKGLEAQCVTPGVTYKEGVTHCALLHGALRAPAAVLQRLRSQARERTVTVVVVDNYDDSYSSEALGADTPAAKRLARQVADLVYAGRITAANHQLLHSLALLAVWDFGEQWLIRSAESVAADQRSRKPIGKLNGYLVGTAREKLWSMSDIEEVGGKAERQSWFGRFLEVAENVVKLRLPAPAETPSRSATEAKREAPPTPDQRRETQAAVLAVLAAQAATGDPIAQARLRRLEQGPAGAEGAAAGAAAENTLKRELQPKARGP